jgi:hypothetical protein
MLAAGILLIPALATLWMAWQKFLAPVASEPVNFFSLRRGSTMLVKRCLVDFLGRAGADGKNLQSTIKSGQAGSTKRARL